jgi:hypothetical protein
MTVKAPSVLCAPYDVDGRVTAMTSHTKTILLGGVASMAARSRSPRGCSARWWRRTSRRRRPGRNPGIQFGTQLFACYKLKCPKIAGESNVSDQFGVRPSGFTSAKLVCAAANISAPPG